MTKSQEATGEKKGRGRPKGSTKNTPKKENPNKGIGKGKIKVPFATYINDSEKKIADWNELLKSKTGDEHRKLLAKIKQQQVRINERKKRESNETGQNLNGTRFDKIFLLLAESIKRAKVPTECYLKIRDKFREQCGSAFTMSKSNSNQIFYRKNKREVDKTELVSLMKKIV